MPPRKEVYHEKQEVSSTVWITYSFVDESQFGQYKPSGYGNHSLRRDANVYLRTRLAWGTHRLYFVQYLWSDDSVYLSLWYGSDQSADPDVFLANI